MKRSLYRTAPLALAALLLLAPALCAETHTAEPFQGVTVHRLVQDQPRPLIIHVVEIDLTAEGISFLATPGNGDPNGDEPGDPNNETTRQTTLNFLKTSGAQLAINATFFGMGTLDTDNIGLVVSNGEHVSPFRGDWPAINIDPDNRPTIVWGEDDTYDLNPNRVTHAPGCENPDHPIILHNAFAGSDHIVIQGRPLDHQPDRKFFTDAHPRTAIGYTDDQKLLLVTVDGRQPGVSEGMPLDELADFMIKLGAVEAINLDGGGSTTLAIAAPEPELLNTPSSKYPNGTHGAERMNATSLAVFAEPSPVPAE